jgi:hypothetical protein
MTSLTHLHKPLLPWCCSLPTPSLYNYSGKLIAHRTASKMVMVISYNSSLLGFFLFFSKPSSVVIFQIILPDSMLLFSFPFSDVALVLFEQTTMYKKIKAPHFTCNDHVEIHGIIRRDTTHLKYHTHKVFLQLLSKIRCKWFLLNVFFNILMGNGSVKCRKRKRIKIIQKFLKVFQYPHLTDATKWIALSQYDCRHIFRS